MTMRPTKNKSIGRESPFQLNRRQLIGGSTALGLCASFVTDAAAQKRNRGGHLIAAAGNAGASDSLDPALFNGDFVFTLGPQLYDSLTVVDEHVQVQPALADKWEAKPGAAEWVFKLRKGVTFHNGKEMTAADVIFSINHHRGPDSRSVAGALVAAIEDIRETAPHEVTITLSSSNADLPFIFADTHLAIVPEGSNFTDGIGTGAFVLEKFEPGVLAQTRRNPNDYRSDRGYMETVETIAINDTAARLSALLSGSAHLICKVDPNSVVQLERLPQFQVFNVPGSGHLSLAMRCDAAPFDNLDLRLALKYAIDREKILQIVLRRNGTIGNDQPIPRFDPTYASDIPQRAYDPDKAKFHFKKSAHDAPVVLTSDNGALDLAQIFQASAAKAGITINLNRVPSDGYYNNIWQHVPFCASNWGGRTTADMMLSTAYASNSPFNETKWYSPAFDEKLIAARSELNLAKRRELYRDLQLMIHEVGGAIIPVFYNYIDAGSADIRGFVPMSTRQFSGYRAPEKVWFGT